jgi:hypothetical protein
LSHFFRLIPAPHQEANQSTLFVELPMDRTAPLPLAGQTLI